MDNPQTLVTLDTKRITNTNKKEAQHIYDLVLVCVIDDNDTQADEAHIMCLKISNKNKNSAVYLVFISVKVRSLIYNR
jgi:hypothetical protein